MCQRLALSLRTLDQVLRIRRKRRDPIVGSDLPTWMRPNRRCQIGATQISFNDRVRPRAACESSGKPTFDDGATDVQHMSGPVSPTSALRRTTTSTSLARRRRSTTEAFQGQPAVVRSLYY